MQAPRLRYLRERQALTQEQLAERAGVTATTISRVESGDGVRVTTLAKLAAALGVEPRELIEEVAPPKDLPAQSPAEPEREASIVGMEMLDTARQLYDQFGYALWLGVALTHADITPEELAERAHVPAAFVHQLLTVGAPGAEVQNDHRMWSLNIELGLMIARRAGDPQDDELQLVQELVQATLMLALRRGDARSGTETPEPADPEWCAAA